VGTPGAKEGDKINGIDTHIILVPSPGGPVPTPTPLPFVGTISQNVAASVFLQDKAAAIEGSIATNEPAHVPPGGSFLKTPSNKATVHRGSASVFIENRPAARMGDSAMTCNDPADAPNGTVFVAGSSNPVLVGD
jgi:uncharacterized Zn-binding protein involved in type VI secretion